MKLILETNEFNHVGSYQAVVTVDLVDYSVTPKVEAAFTVTINECAPTITASTAPAPTPYTVLDPAQTISIGVYSFTPACALEFSYEAVLVDGGVE